MISLEFLVSSLNNAGLNYRMDLGLAIARGKAGHPPAEIVDACVRDTVIATVTPAYADEALAALTAALNRAPDEGSGPNPRFFASEECRVVRAAVLRDMRELLAEAESITAITWTEGSFLTPLHWGFGYVFEVGADAMVLIGAATD